SLPPPGLPNLQTVPRHDRDTTSTALSGNYGTDNRTVEPQRRGWWGLAFPGREAPRSRLNTWRVPRASSHPASSRCGEVADDRTHADRVRRLGESFADRRSAQNRACPAPGNTLVQPG